MQEESIAIDNEINQTILAMLEEQPNLSVRHVQDQWPTEGPWRPSCATRQSDCVYPERGAGKNVRARSTLALQR